MSRTMAPQTVIVVVMAVCSTIFRAGSLTSVAIYTKTVAMKTAEFSTQTLILTIGLCRNLNDNCLNECHNLSRALTCRLRMIWLDTTGSYLVCEKVINDCDTVGVDVADLMTFRYSWICVTGFLSHCDVWLCISYPLLYHYVTYCYNQHAS